MKSNTHGRWRMKLRDVLLVLGIVVECLMCILVVLEDKTDAIIKE